MAAQANGTVSRREARLVVSAWLDSEDEPWLPERAIGTVSVRDRD